MRLFFSRNSCYKAQSVYSMAKDTLDFYSSRDFLFSVKVHEIGNSPFDQKLVKRWCNRLEQGCFRYKIPSSDFVPTRRTSGSLNLVVQLNQARGTQRRIPSFMTTLRQPFDDEAFHFCKVRPEETLMSLRWEDDPSTTDEHNDPTVDLLIINVSPLEFGHSLFVPDVFLKRTQLLTEVAPIRRALNLLLLSSSADFRLCFNGICAFASVNHLHFHVYYVRHRLALETWAVEKLTDRIHVVKDYTCPALALQVKSREDLAEVCRLIQALAEYCLEKDVAYNLYATRGTAFEDRKVAGSLQAYSTIRVYFWPRKKVMGAKVETSFNAACCELAGHVVVNDAPSYDVFKDQDALKVFKDVALDADSWSDFLHFASEL